MAILIWVSDHRYQARRPSDDALLGSFRLNSAGTGYVFEAAQVVLRVDDIQRLYEQFVELDRNLWIERQRAAMNPKDHKGDI